ncbi:MAG: SDR family NAD(P)-dependent oxidoreductase, partial [Pseudobdellovibrionaceae bacterium]
MKNWVLLGASRGFGLSFLQKAASENILIHNFSRKPAEAIGSVENHAFDFSNEERWEELSKQIQALAPERIFYFAGGGPFGNYQAKNWKDHQWALRVTFELPAFLLHQCLRNPKELKQFVVIGSSVAESYADPQASSYSSAKHAIKGLVTSVQAEQKAAFDLRLFSPGYMDTELLPANAWPRQQAGLVKSPAEMAEMLWAWIH